MDNYCRGILGAIGRTPMIEITRIDPDDRAAILAKIEAYNPSGSVKDRIAAFMVRKAEEQGLLRPGGTMVEASSGNTGIGLAMVAAALGYKLILVMPDTMSQERQALLKAYGAELYLTPGHEGMQGSLNLAEKLLEENPHFYMPRQFENPANPEIHRITTAWEVIEQTGGGRVDAFVAGIGTGGTITGVGEVLRQYNPKVLLVGVEPAGSPVLSGGKPGLHRIQGIGAGFVPKVLNQNLLDRVIAVDDLEAFYTAQELGRREGICIGISAGAAMWAALQIAKELGPGKCVATVLPDTGERYLSVAAGFRQELRRKGIEG
ncbi:MAG: cysteine synthase A [Bacillota bacterium]